MSLPRLAAAALLAAGCQAGPRMDRTDMPKLAGTQYGYDIERFRGQTVRVCGRLVQRESHWAVEYIPREGDAFFHGYPAVLIAGCQETPRLDRQGCLAGRIAAIDGSLNPPPRRIDDDTPISRDWFLHPQCSAPRR